jgi:hypothetical protein
MPAGLLARVVGRIVSTPCDAAPSERMVRGRVPWMCLMRTSRVLLFAPSTQETSQWPERLVGGSRW